MVGVQKRRTPTMGFGIRPLQGQPKHNLFGITIAAWRYRVQHTNHGFMK